MRNEMNTRAVVETGILTAVGLIFTFIGTTVPLASFFATFFMPAVLIIIGVRHSVKYSLLSLVTIAILLVFFGLYYAAPIVIASAAGAVLFVWLYDRGYSYTVLFSVPPVLTVAITIGIFLISALAFGLDVMSYIADDGAKVLQDLADLYRQGGYDEAQISATIDGLRPMVALLPYIIVGSLYVSAGFVNFLTYKIAALVLRRMGFQLRYLKPFRSYYAPKASLYAVLISFLVMYAGNHIEGMRWLAFIGGNALYISCVFLYLNGLASLWGWLSKYTKSDAAFVLIAILSVFWVYGFLIWGALDMFLDLRRRVNAPDTQHKK